MSQERHENSPESYAVQSHGVLIRVIEAMSVATSAMTVQEVAAAADCSIAQARGALASAELGGWVESARTSSATRYHLTFNFTALPVRRLLAIRDDIGGRLREAEQLVSVLGQLGDSFGRTA